MYKSLYFQVIVAIIAGATIGHFYPELGTDLKPLGDAFIKLVKMIIAPIIFLTIVNGIAGMSNLKGLGRVAGKSMAYFLTFSTLALIIGLIVANTVKPGSGMGIDPATLDETLISGYASQVEHLSLVSFLLNIIPSTVVGAFTGGNILQVLFVAVLFGISLAGVGERGKLIHEVLESVSVAFFRLVAIVMRAAPIGAFGAFAFTIGNYGIASLSNLAVLVATFYFTSIAFIIGVLGLVCLANGFSIFKLIRYLKEELLLVLGTSSSEAALPSLMEKMEAAGCEKTIVGLVVPMGYSFNLDGTNIYMTLAALFIAQATGVDLSFGDQMAIVLVAMVSSKGAAGVSGAGFVTLAATLTIIPSLPVAGMALLLGIDRFMSECRAITNFIGNSVATVVVANWENKLDRTKFNQALNLKTSKTPGKKIIPSKSSTGDPMSIDTD